MTYDLTFAARCSDEERTRKFEEAVRGVHTVLAEVAGEWQVPNLTATVVFADDFVGTADELLAVTAAAWGEHHHPYTTDRVGGEAVAKNIPTAGDDSSVSIVFNSNMHHFAGPAQDAMTLFIAAHELTHPILQRLRDASGALAGVTFPSQTASQYARSIVRIAVDEYRCDRVANAILGAMCTATIDGETRRLRQSDLLGGDFGYRGSLSTLLDEHVHPAWPDLVQNYRERRIPLGQMWGRLVTATDQTMTLLAHAEAEAVAAEEAGPVDGPHAAHPAVRLYLGPAWSAVMDAVEKRRWFLRSRTSPQPRGRCSTLGNEHCSRCGSSSASPSRPRRPETTTCTSRSPRADTDVVRPVTGRRSRRCRSLLADHPHERGWQGEATSEPPDLEGAADLYGEREVATLRALVCRLVAEWADAERRAAYGAEDPWQPPEWVPTWARP